MTATGLLLDQVTKVLAVRHLEPGAPVPLVPGLLDLELIRNPGAAFSMGSGATVAISCLAIAATIGVLWWAVTRVATVAQAAMAGLALAGIVGNLLDRLLRAPGPMRGHVIDFFHLRHFAIFNVADIFITLTAVALVLASFWPRGADTPEEDPA